jgi:farnesyl diphosphate synthase
VLGLEQARAHALSLRAQAQAALSRSGLADTSALALLADKVVERDN